MTDKNIDAQETQLAIATKLNAIAVRRIAAEGLKEQDDELIEDLVALYKEAGNKKSKGDVQLVAKVYTDAEKTRKDEQAKIDKSTQVINKIDEVKEELSVLARFQFDNMHDEAEAITDAMMRVSEDA